MSGHILRRFLGARWTKQEEVEMCNDCHRDRDAMAQVEREAAPDGSVKPSDARFIHASDSYEMTLHGRLVRENSDHGVSCNQCHAPAGLHHSILAEEDPESAVHPTALAEHCGSSGCHGYVDSTLNEGFLRSDMHDLDWTPGYAMSLGDGGSVSLTPWLGALYMTGPVALVIAVVGLFWTVLKGRDPKAISLLGGKRFDRVFLARKPKGKKVNKKTDQVVLDEMVERGHKRAWARRFWRSRNRRGEHD
jgi:sulfite reductase (NADPH) flavoprotein alpha-component